MVKSVNFEKVLEDMKAGTLERASAMNLEALKFNLRLCLELEDKLNNKKLEIDAAKAYNNAAIKHFGKFAVLNEV